MPQLLLSFPDAASAERRIAGLPVIARAVAEAARAGIGDIGVAIGEGQLSMEARSEIDRVRGGAAVRMLEGDAQGVPTVFAGTGLLTSIGIARLLKTPGTKLLHGDLLVAVNDPGPGGAALQADASEAIDLREPGAAAREIVRRTAKPGDGLVSRWLNRPVSQAISGVLLRIRGIRPWHATVGAAVIGAVMMLELLFGGKTGLIAGGLLFHTASVIDGVDGEIARATFRNSRFGAILDTTIDMITNLGFFAGFTIALVRLYGPIHWVGGGLAVGLAIVGMLAMSALSRRVGEPGNFNILKRYYAERFPTGIPAAIVWILVTLISRDMFAFVFAVVILLGGAAIMTFTLAGFISLWVVTIVAATPALLRSAPAYSPASA
ncbi:MAG: CDP-alcohol phosphatidyltransferase family protein [Pseudomonadota bacterium]